MTFGLTFSVVFGVIFAAALILGFCFEKDLKEFETVLFKFIKLKIKAYRSGMSVEEYVQMKRSQKRCTAKAHSNVIDFNDWVA